MRSHDELDRALRELERWTREHEREHQQFRTDIRAEVEDMNDAAARHVVDVLRPIQADVRTIEKKVDGITASNDTILKLSELSALERGRRAQRDEDDEKRRRDSALELERKKLVVEENKVDADLVKAQVDARVRRVVAIASLIGVIGVALVGAFSATCASQPSHTSGGH